MSRRPAEKDQHIPLSISHDGDYATAFCLASEDMLPAGDPIPEDEALLEDEALSEDDTISEDDVEPAGPSRNASEPNSVRPPMTEEETLQKLNRQARLLERTESIYGLPPDVDPKVVKKNLENAAIVYDVPLETSSQELIDLFKGRCTVKGYVEKRSHREIARGFLVFQYARDAKRAMREAKFGTYMLRGKRLLIASVPEVPKNILKVYARCLKSDGFPLRGMAEGEIQQMDLDVNMGAKAIRKAIVHGQTINSIKLGEFWSTDIYHVQDNCANNVEP
jgi:RNA recognition motif-containing protein